MDASDSMLRPANQYHMVPAGTLSGLYLEPSQSFSRNQGFALPTSLALSVAHTAPLTALGNEQHVSAGVCWSAARLVAPTSRRGRRFSPLYPSEQSVPKNRDQAPVDSSTALPGQKLV